MDLTNFCKYIYLPNVNYEFEGEATHLLIRL